MNTVCFNAEKFYRIAYDYFYYESDLKAAKRYVNKALKSDLNHFKSLILKGQILLVENDTRHALEYFLSALKIEPNEPKCLSYIASAYDLIGKYDLALEYLNRVFKQKIEDKDFLSECYRLKISLLINLNQWQKAVNTLKTLNNKLYTNDIFYIEETFYNTIKSVNNADKRVKNSAREHILHVNF